MTKEIIIFSNHLCNLYSWRFVNLSVDFNIIFVKTISFWIKKNSNNLSLNWCHLSIHRTHRTYTNNWHCRWSIRKKQQDEINDGMVTYMWRKSTSLGRSHSIYHYAASNMCQDQTAIGDLMKVILERFDHQDLVTRATNDRLKSLRAAHELPPPLQELWDDQPNGVPWRALFRDPETTTGIERQLNYWSWDKIDQKLHTWILETTPEMQWLGGIRQVNPTATHEIEWIKSSKWDINSKVHWETRSALEIECVIINT